MNIIFDLDGTLIDSSERMYRLFQKLILDSEFSKDEYWDLKRNKVNHRMILEKYFIDYSYDVFNQRFLDEIENDEYLNMDDIYPDTKNVLEILSKSNYLVLLTARQRINELYDELLRLDIKKFFDQILVTEGKVSKEGLLKEAFDSFIEIKNDSIIYISDMGKDITDGKKYGCNTIAITHGFMSREKLIAYDPNYIVNELSEIIPIVEEIEKQINEGR